MALNKQSQPINFAQGLDLKTDPKQVPVGKFLALSNTVFTKGNLLAKRNGYKMLTPLPDDSSVFATTFNGNLTAIGTRLQAYSAGSQRWTDKGAIRPVQLSTLSLVRSSTNQSQCDSVVASNGLICTAFTDNVPVNGVNTPVYKYVIADSTTGQNIIAPTTLANGSGAPRVFVLGNYFIIVFSAVVAATPRLQYVSVSIANPSISSGPTNITSQYTPSDEVAWDGIVANNNLYLAWNGSDGGGAIRMTRLDSNLTLFSAKVFAGSTATTVSVTADTSGSTANVYVAFYDSGSQDGYLMITSYLIASVLAPTQIINNENVANITLLASDDTADIYYEVNNSYSYDSDLPTNYIKTLTCDIGGTVGSASVLIRSVGLASKAFKVSDTTYILTVFGSSYQPSYFLVDEDSNIVAKVAYSNGGGYLTEGLPSVTVTSNVAQIPYLVKDSIQSVNKTQGVANTVGIYSQTGVNLASFTVGTSDIVSAEIGNDLHLSGGFLWMYDGYTPVEHGFFVWPDDVEAAEVPTITYTGTTSSGSNQVTALSSTVNLVVGMTVTGTGIPVNTVITDISGSTITISHNATATNSGVSLTFVGVVGDQQYYYQATYEWSDNQGNVFRSAPSIPVGVQTSSGAGLVTLDIPTLRLTYKTANPVTIVIYRWSTAQQTYYQVTSLQVPILNDTTVDSVQYVDSKSDAEILGNNILYTTGGVVENISAPACTTMALFKSRLVLADAEDENLLWYSKQVIENTPVELSDLFTIYVAPTTGSQGATGPTRAISAMDDKLIAFKPNAIYYLVGNGPDNTGANNDFSEPVFITSTVGCSNQRSIVMTPQGLMFQSDKGIWLLSRDLSTQYIGAAVESLTDGATVESAVNIPGTNQVRFTLDTGITLMYDYYYGQWGTFTNVPAISSTLFEGLHTYINDLGQVFQETPGLYQDGSNPVLMSFTTGWLNLAGLQGYERAYYFYLLGTFISPHKLQVQIAYDYVPSKVQSSLISPDNYNGAYGSDTLYGGGNPYGGTDSVEQWRVFLQQQKCEAFQITVNELFDSTIGTGIPGAGLTLSGINLIVGTKSNYPRLRAAKSVG